MFTDVTIGQYYPTGSVVHKLDPRTKIIIALIYIVLLFFVTNLAGFGLMLVFLVLAIALSKIPVGYILKGLKPLLFIIIFTVGINLFMTPGETIWNYGFLKITYEGLDRSLFMAIRLILLVSGSTLLTLVTSPIALTDGMEILLSKIPLVKRIAHEISMMMSIALRFIPTLMEETTRIINAQKSRGADFESGNVFARAKAFIPVLIPLFLSAFTRAEDLALAMEARCYRGGENRTRLKELKYESIDIKAYFVIVLVIAGIAAINFFTPAGIL